jgi:hypothetical protein
VDHRDLHATAPLAAAHSRAATILPLLPYPKIVMTRRATILKTLIRFPSVQGEVYLGSPSNALLPNGR